MAVAPSQLTAVLLTGGRSKRMGQDKAFLPWGPEQSPVWLVQLKKLSALNCAHLFLSAHSNQRFPSDLLATFRATLKNDPTPYQGPLGGFFVPPSPFFLPLAVDMPALPVPVLKHLIDTADPDRGLVFHENHLNRYQPFPAVYPASIAKLARKNLDRHERSLQKLIKQAVARHVLHSMPLPPQFARFFKSTNFREDLPPETFFSS
ncbi:MAG: molybdenum cofactor guanylyltransferase [Verrucomicrobiota bacterium]